jgi:hypothetical protein
MLRYRRHLTAIALLTPAVLAGTGEARKAQRLIEQLGREG